VKKLKKILLTAVKIPVNCNNVIVLLADWLWKAALPTNTL